jgi:bacteriocin-like protein
MAEEKKKELNENELDEVSGGTAPRRTGQASTETSDALSEIWANANK